MTRKVCKKCRLFFEGDKCPLCQNTSLATSWQGRVNILDANKSQIAKKSKIEIKGEYAIKTR